MSTPTEKVVLTLDEELWERARLDHINPSVLFFDQPTSNLSTYASIASAVLSFLLLIVVILKK